MILPDFECSHPYQNVTIIFRPLVVQPILNLGMNISLFTWVLRNKKYCGYRLLQNLITPAIIIQVVDFV